MVSRNATRNRGSSPEFLAFSRSDGTSPTSGRANRVKRAIRRADSPKGNRDPITPLPRRSVHSLRPKIAARSSREQKRAYPRDYLARNNPSGRCLSYYSSRCHGMLATDSGSANMPAERQRSFANVSTTSDESRDRLHLANLAIGVCVKGIGRFGDFHAEIAGCCLRQKKLF